VNWVRTRLVNDPDGPYTSVAGSVYQAWKSALDMLTVHYAKEPAHDQISVLSVSRGIGPPG
jgi:NAD(P)-dependent dehydrogenase (short-subunit alcohol dehydrogenase family)